MTEFTPISGGNISELNKIPDLFLNKRSLLVLKNNDNKYVYTGILLLLLLFNSIVIIYFVIL